MIQETYKFQTGELSITDSSLVFNDGTNVVSINRKHIGEMFTLPTKILAKNQVVYIFRLAFISAIMFGVGLIFSFAKGVNFLAWLGIGGLIFSAFLLFAFFFIDGLLGLKLASSILMFFCGRQMVKVVIQNTSDGNNFEFYILQSDQDKIPKMELMVNLQ